jgi:hypothetical protein
MLKLMTETQETDTLAILFGLVFVVLTWFSFTLAIGGFFFFPLVIVGLAIFGIAAVYIGWKLLTRSPLDFKIAFLIAILFTSVVCYFSGPTFFSGRDQGSIAEAAFRLAQNGQLAFTTPASASFFKIYDEGTALNFPGFAYTRDGDLITQFPLGYTSWLASFVILFGLYGYAIGNAVLLFLFLFSLYNLLRTFAHPYYAFSGLTLALFSFLPMWFAKFTLSENLSLFLFVFLAYNLILFLRDGRPLSYTSILLTAGLFAFTRIEGFAFLAISLIILFWNKNARHIWKTYPWQSIVLPIIIFIFFFLRDFFINLPYYKMIAKALLKFLNQLGAGSVTGDLANTSSSLSLGAIFFLYGLLVLFAIGFFGLLVFIKEKRYFMLLPAVLALPTFIYFFDPNISLDHPWMLRRYLFSLFPALLFSAVVGLALIFTKKKEYPIAKPQGKRLFLVSLIFLGLLLLQYPAWSTGIFFTENRALLKQVANFSQEFSDKDLILVDRNATGDGFAMLTGPAQFLFGKNAIYFFNPYDLANLDITPFEHVYLLVPEGDQARYVAVFGERLVFQKTVTFSLEQFENLSLKNESPLRLPKTTSQETRNLLFQIY